MFNKQAIAKKEIIEESGFFCLPLDNVTDENYADCCSLWKPQGGFVSIRDSIIGRRKQWLRFALGRHTCPDDENGSKEYIYTNVILKIPQKHYHKLLRNQKLIQLTRGLEKRHLKDLPKNPLNGRDPTYIALPDETMADGNAEFLFGDMVFVPNPEDQLLYTIEFGLESSATQFHSVQWHIPEYPKPIPAGLYKEQTKGICIGISPSPYVVNGDVLNGQPFDRIYIVPDGGNLERLHIFADYKHVDTLDMAGKNEVLCKITPDRFSVKDASEIPPALILRFKRQVPVAQDKNDSIEKEAPKSPQESSDKTAVKGNQGRANPDITCRYGRPDRARVKLEGFLLPRLDEKPLIFVDNDEELQLKSWVLWFDNHGTPYKEPVNDPGLTLSTNNNNGLLYIKEEGQQEFSKIEGGFNDGDVCISPPPDQLSDEFIGILEIPTQTIAFEIKNGVEKICGRSKEADIPLNLLNVHESLIYDNGTSGSNWDRMLTSSRHASVELMEDDALQVTQLSRSMPIYILSKDNELLEELPPIRGNDACRQVLVHDGQKVVIGAYLLRFVGSRLHSARP